MVINAGKGNVLTRQVMDDLRATLEAHAGDRHLRLVVIRGAGGNFSFGASVPEHRAGEARTMLASFHRMIRALAGFPAPVAALVEGKCLGGAFEVALCCHFVFATANALFGCPEIKLGVFPPVFAAVGAARLPGALAERMLLTGESVDAKTLERVGFLTRLFDGPEDPEAALLAFYREHLAPLSAFSLRQAARACRDASGLADALAGPLDGAERRYLDKLLPSHDGNEGIEAFIARRPPVWKDE
ncbi:MAG: enoyl-CoA hydratase/isomerase family protein [Planctomycetes bacterium]|nr:enoyl-CoA hydratase/isomerase family protein [Planctomycetota bacterium]